MQALASRASSCDDAGGVTDGATRRLAAVGFAARNAALSAAQTDYNKWDKIVAALSDDEDDALAAARGSSASAVPPGGPAEASPVGVGVGLTGASQLAVLSSVVLAV